MATTASDQNAMKLEGTSDQVLERMEETAEQESNDSNQEVKDSAPEKPASPPQQQQQKLPGGEEKKPSKLKQLWEKTGLDPMTLKMMFKGSLPPTIAIAMYQSDAVSGEYTTLGYLVAISSILGFAIMPRGKFIQTMSLNVLGICLAAATNLLALFCVVKAREHTSTPLPPPAPGQPAPPTYNSSASAVCALWLIIEVYTINFVRAARPQYQFPCILATIFTIVGLTYGVTFQDMSDALSFMKRLLTAFLTGFGLATATHILVFPTSSRKIVFLQMTGYLKLMNGVLKLQTAYMGSLQAFDPAKAVNQANSNDKKDDKKKRKKKKIDEHTDDILSTPPAIKLRETQNKLLELHAKLSGDVTSAKREIAFGKLESHDITELWRLLRLAFLPVVGLSSMINILERLAVELQWNKSADELTTEEKEARDHQLDHMHFLMNRLHNPMGQMVGSLDGAFQHILLTLEFEKPDKKQKQPDVESKGDEPAKPGTPGFAAVFKQQTDNFYESKQKTLLEWCKEHNIELPPDFFESSFVAPENISYPEASVRERRQRQLFFILYVEYLLWRCSRSMLDVILYVDKRKQEGALDKSKVIFPGSKTIYKWIRSTFGKEDFNHEDSYTADFDAGGQQSLYLSEKFRKLRDPEHNPPQNSVERFGNLLRKIPNGLRSDASAFGLRVAAATMTLGIVAFLRDTQLWFLQQRGLWALIMTGMSMNRTSGQSVFNFVLRVLGTAIAMVASYVIWYIVDRKTPGILVFLWLWIFMAFYVVLKFPKMAIVGILSLVTAILIVGYELQVRIIGTAIAESNGQPAYPLYILAPYRLASVTLGIFVAFIWTVFPYPISETSELRNDISSCMFLLSAFYENVHETVSSRVGGRAGNLSRKGSHAYNLDRARRALFGKLIIVLSNLKTNSEFSQFQLSIGGKFPKEEYMGLITTLRRLMLWTSLASYSSVSFEDGSDQNLSQWSATFRQVLANTNTSSHSITSLLSILSSSLSNGTPLPPYIQMPEPFAFVRRVNEVDKDLLSIRHIAEPEYSAFAVMQIVARLINEDIVKLREHVKNLVGEIDFSYRAIQDKSSSSSIISTSTAKSDDNEKDKDD